MKGRAADVVLVDGTGYVQRCDLILERYYATGHDYESRERLRRRRRQVYDTVSDSTTDTAYVIPFKGQRPQTVDNKSPRFAIWYGDEDLTVCCTAVYRCSDVSTLPAAVLEAIEWSSSRYGRVLETTHESVAVLDLDQTLITDSGDNFLNNYEHVLASARQNYDRVVLWSHGDPLHVDTYVSRMSFEFDLVLSRDKNNEPNCKNLLHLYNYFEPGVRIKYATLVDDTPSNWSPEYDSMIVPVRGITDIKPIALAMEFVAGNRSHVRHGC